jgi:hypothetical protein
MEKGFQCFLLILQCLQTYFWWWVCHAAVRACSREGVWDTGVGRSGTIQPNYRGLIENPLAGYAAIKIRQKVSSANLLLMEKCNQLLLIERFW